MERIDIMKKIIDGIKKTVTIMTLGAIMICTVTSTSQAVRYGNYSIQKNGQMLRKDAKNNYSNTIVDGYVTSTGAEANVNAGASMVERGYYIVKTGLGRAVSNSNYSQLTVAWHSYDVGRPNDHTGPNRWNQNNLK